MQSDPVALVDRLCSPIATNQFRAVVRCGCRDQGIVRSAAGNLAIRQTLKEFSMSGGVQPQQRTRKTGHEEITHYFAGCPMGRRQSS